MMSSKGRARLDLKSHWRYLARDNLPAADRLLEAAKETFKLIAEILKSAPNATFESSWACARAESWVSENTWSLPNSEQHGCDRAGSSWHAGFAKVLF